MHHSRNRDTAKSARNSCQWTPATGGACLALTLVEHHVFRAAVLSIVLTLAIGPNASLLCSVWCHPGAATTSTCQHQDATPSPRVTGEDSCKTAPSNATALIRKEARRGSPTPRAQQVIAVRQFQFVPPPTATSRAYETATSRVAAAPPFLIALRI